MAGLFFICCFVGIAVLPQHCPVHYLPSVVDLSKVECLYVMPNGYRPIRRYNVDTAVLSPLTYGDFQNSCVLVDIFQGSCHRQKIFHTLKGVVLNLNWILFLWVRDAEINSA